MSHCSLGCPWPGPRRIARKSRCHIVLWGVPGRDQAESPEYLGVTLYFGVSLAKTKPNRQQIEVSHCAWGCPWPGPNRMARKSKCHIVLGGVPCRGRNRDESPENLSVTLYLGVSLAGTGTESPENRNVSPGNLGVTS